MYTDCVQRLHIDPFILDADKLCNLINISYFIFNILNSLIFAKSLFSMPYYCQEQRTRTDACITQHQGSLIKQSSS